MRKATTLAMLAASLAAGPAARAATTVTETVPRLALPGESVAALVVQSRTALDKASFEATTRKDATSFVDQAESAADSALVADVNDYDALLAKAKALGARAGLDRSRSEAIEARRMMAALTQRRPERPEAWHALGVWNGEVVDQLGMLSGILGASKGEMTRRFEQAIVLAPRDPLYPATYGLLLLRLDGPSEQSTKLLLRALALAPLSEPGRRMQDQARQVLGLLSEKQTREARTLATALSPFGKL